MQNRQLSQAQTVLANAVEQVANPLRQLAVLFGRSLRGPPIRVCRIDRERPAQVDWQLPRNGLPKQVIRSRGCRDRDCG